jgi:hypothetical protein
MERVMAKLRCIFCGTETNLVTEKYRDEDGFASEDPIDLCHDCVEHAEDRRKARQEWEYYHDEPCPEIELPQPGPSN